MYLPKDNSDTGDKRDPKGRWSFMRIFEGVGQTWLALLIVVPAFILIFYMLFMQQSTITQAVTAVGMNSADATKVTALTNFYRELYQSNQNMFALMTTVFGAWVGAVVAFYFGAKNLQAAQGSINKIQQDQGDAIRKALSPGEKLSQMTVEQLLNENPTAKNPIAVNMKKSNIGEVKKKFSDNRDLTNVLVVDDNQKPLGLLYLDDLAKLKSGDETSEATDGKPLVERIENIKDDFVTHKSWNKDIGIKNYAELSLVDNLQMAQTKMQEVADKPSVRGLVLNMQGMVVGIVDHTMISAVLQKEK
jgi:hypothetical protein